MFGLCFRYALLCVLSSFGIIKTRNRELVYWFNRLPDVLFLLMFSGSYSWCFGLFPDHTDVRFAIYPVTLYEADLKFFPYSFWARSVVVTKLLLHNL